MVALSYLAAFTSLFSLAALLFSTVLDWNASFPMDPIYKDWLHTSGFDTRLFDD